MWICKNCNHQITESFTDCWRCGYSKKGNPPTGGSFVSDKEMAADPSAKKLRKLRLKAFIADYVIVVVAWAILDNLVYFPIPNVVIELGAALFFCGYFVLFEGMSKINQSPGKRWVGLKVVTLDGHQVSNKAVFWRSAIVATIIIVDFTWLLGLLQVPGAVVWLGWSIPAGLVVYNAWLAVKQPGGSMLQDHFTATRVVPISATPQDTPAMSAVGDPEPLIRFPRPGLAVNCILAVSILTLACVHGIHSFVGVGDPWSWPDAEVSNVETIMEQAVAEEMGFRCYVSLTASREITSGSEDVLSLEISVWIPAVRWNEETIARLPATVLEPLIITPGLYDRANLVIWTGFENINAHRNFNLDLP